MGMCRCEHGLVRSLWHDFIIVRIFVASVGLIFKGMLEEDIYEMLHDIYYICEDVYRLHVNINNIHDGFLPLGKDWSAI